jgi:hypothetical protein
MFMNSMIKAMVVIFILWTMDCGLSTSFASTHQDVGTSGAQSLEVELGVRPAGMGGAFVAVADDANALHWNPAGLSQVKYMELSTTDVQNFEDMRTIDMSFIYPLDEAHSSNIKSLGTLGFNVSLFNMGTLVGRNVTGVATGDFKSQDRIINISYGKYIIDGLSLGATGKFLTQEIEAYKTEVYAFDIGGLYKTGVENLSLGFCVQNLGNQIKVINEADNLPRNVKVGLAYKMFNEDLTLAVDVNKPLDNFYRVNTGIEYWLGKVLALRVGYRSRYDISNGVSAGVGLSIKDFDFSFMPIKEIVFDYAYTPYGDLGNNQQIALLLKMGVK